MIVLAFAFVPILSAPVVCVSNVSVLVAVIVVPPKIRLPFIRVLPVKVVEARVDEPVEIKVPILLVLALVVEAFSVVKLAVVPNSVATVPETAFKVEAKKLLKTFKLVIDEVAATSEFVFRLVVVAFVIVPLVAVTELPESPGAVNIPVTARLVIVALVKVALPAFSADATNSAKTALLE